MTGAAQAQTLEIDARRVTVRPIADDEEVRACAEIMSTSDPWVTLGRTVEQAQRILSDREVQEIYVALHEGAVVGFVILILKGALVGYIRTIAVHADWRSRGLGRRLIWFAEERIFRESPNVFLCVSSFNPRARSLYERLGYETVGELRDYIVRGHSEWLMRKTLGPYAEFRRDTA
ncbi:MAG: GNAT family N-acetyltransferase [Gemmatimonadota bacterium]|nr:GNAT family N-acetyltransferase [Gemmatimonadota bacterium]